MQILVAPSPIGPKSRSPVTFQTVHPALISYMGVKQGKWRLLYRVDSGELSVLAYRCEYRPGISYRYQHFSPGNKLMNALANQFPSLYTDLHNQIVRVMTGPNEPILTPGPALIERKPLIGYESIMRRHAAACEAGR